MNEIVKILFLGSAKDDYNLNFDIKNVKDVHQLHKGRRIRLELEDSREDNAKNAYIYLPEITNVIHNI